MFSQPENLIQTMKNNKKNSYETILMYSIRLSDL